MLTTRIEQIAENRKPKIQKSKKLNQHIYLSSLIMWSSKAWVEFFFFFLVFFWGWVGQVQLSFQFSTPTPLPNPETLPIANCLAVFSWPTPRMRNVSNTAWPLRIRRVVTYEPQMR